MKKLIVLVIAVTALAGCASSPLLPQMQKWDTQDQILGGIFITECVWDGYETKRYIYNDSDKWKETSPYIKDKKDAIIFGALGMYTGLKVADGFPEIRTPLLIILCIIEWGGTDVSVKW